MSNFTPNQQQAIQITQGNALVSAGAGSGKTKVLTERVRRLVVEERVPLDRLVVLTFTNAAAHEMKDRIRKELAKNPQTKHLAPQVDASDITTFDAYALSLVKKYHGILGISKEVNNLDEILLDIEKKRIIADLFDEYYQSKPAVFLEFIQRYALRDDSNLQAFVLDIDKKADLKIDKKAYFEHYVETYFSRTFIQQSLQELNQLILKNIDTMNQLSYGIQHEKELNNINELLAALNQSDDFDVTRISVANAVIKNKVAKLEENDAFIHDAIKTLLNQSKTYAELGDKKTLIEQYQSTKPIVELLIDMLIRLNEKVDEFKAKHQSYSFSDIAKMALKLLDNPEVSDQLKANIQYIMIDEYQDTSDLQEAFLHKIANDNLYMVGDIKQSIYRFRNANSAIFADKFSLFGKKQGGRRVDLNHNFRSREEVLQDINFMFSQLMSLEFGGADYRNDHIIEFGNKRYETDLLTPEPHHTSIYTYDADNDPRKDYEIEADLIAQDIRRKIDTGYPVVDRETFKLRPASFHDFTILIDRKSHFEDYRRIFESYAIPLDVEKEEAMLSTDVALTFLSLVRLLHHIQKQDNDVHIQNYFMSIARSFLYRLDDQTIYSLLKDKTYNEHPIMQKITLIADKSTAQSLSMTMIELLEVFDFYHKLITIGNVKSNLAKIQHMVKLSQTLENLQYELSDFISFFDDIKASKMDIKMKDNDAPEDAVSIMSVHGSKGLEFPIVYYAGLAVPFNQPDQKKKFFADGRLGIHLPNTSISGRTFFHHLMMASENQQDMSEKVRLFYVALTRACEKIIIIRKKRKDTLIPSLSQCRCLDDFLTFIQGIEQFNQDFDPYLAANNPVASVPVTTKTLSIEDFSLLPIALPQPTKAGKILEEAVDPTLLTLGSELHYLLEIVDFTQKDTAFILDLTKRTMIDRVLALPLFSDTHLGQVYKEYRYFDDEENIHGIIDGFIVYQDHIDLFDYKLSNIDDFAYDEQVQKYARYLKKAYRLPIRAYLISLVHAKMRTVAIVED